MMSATASLHGDNASGQFGEESKKLVPSKPLAQYDRAIAISAMYLKYVLRQIQPDCDNVFHGRLL